MNGRKPSEKHIKRLIPAPINLLLTRKWHSESADPAKALNLSLGKQTDKQKILATQRFELSTLAFLAQFSYRLSYRAVLI